MQDALLGRLKANHEPARPRDHIVVPVYPIIPLPTDLRIRGMGIEKIKEEVAEYFRLRHTILYGSCKRNALQRQIAMYLCIELTGKSSAVIGRSFKRDHSSVLHAHKKIKQMLADSHIEVSGAVQALVQKLCGE